MIKVYALMNKLPHLTERQFHDHWLHPHGDLTRRMRQVRRYVQNRCRALEDLAAPTPGSEKIASLPMATYTGVAAVWLDTLAALPEMLTDPDYPPLQADGLLLYDPADVIWLITEESIVRRSEADDNAKGPLDKAIWFLRRKAPLSPETFRERFATAVREAANTAFVAARSVSFAVPPSAAYEMSNTPAFDAVVELRDGTAADAGALTEPLAALIDVERSLCFPAREIRVVWPASVTA